MARTFVAAWSPITSICLRAHLRARTSTILDAYAVLWSARRFALGLHTTFGDGQRDARGIEMRIIC